MAIKYEVWEKTLYGASGEKPLATFYLLDSAIRYSEKNSKGTYKTTYYKYDPNKPYQDNQKEIDLPNTVMVVEKGGAKSSVRGFGIGGKWVYAIDCKRCKGDGLDSNQWNLPCNSCKGAGYKPKQ